MNAITFTRFLDTLNREAESRITLKEDAFWKAYMGTAEDLVAQHQELSRREIELQEFMQDPVRLYEVKSMLAAAEAALATRAEDRPTAEEALSLRGWVKTFAANVIDSEEGRRLTAEIVEKESELHQARTNMRLGFTHPKEGFVAASSVKLGTMLTSEPDENLRRAAWEGLSSIEPFVLQNGYLEVVAMRNRLARLLGAEDYYEWKVQRVEGMSKKEIFGLLDELEHKTRDAARSAVDDLRGRQGGAVTPWNIRYLISGDVTKEQDPYFLFSKSFERWGRSFSALCIDYRNAELVLDLLDRKGKYENGFMHCPVPAWREHGRQRSARIHFTANAIPGMVGSGRRAHETLFHEGGHAAHFANVDMPSPCFTPDLPPSSVAFAETQSMFLDSLLSDADWQSRYASDREGRAMPFELNVKAIEKAQPFAAWSLRNMLTVCYAERAVYEMKDEERTAENVLRTLRRVERELLFLDGSPRPVLSVPHLLSGDSSAYYHGYVLAEMAVEQTRRFFLERDGHLTDNPRIGMDLKDHYWREGNARSFQDFIQGMTGKPLSAGLLAARASRSVEQSIAEARERVERLKGIPEQDGPVRLNARVRVVHGNEEIVTATDADFAAAARRFEGWVDSL